MPVVKIERKAWLKMMGYTKAATGEVSGLATVEEVDGSLVITDTLFCRQQATGGHVELSADDLAEKIAELAQTEDGLKQVEQLKVWWHSHVNMGVFRSTTDTDTSKRLLQTMPYMLCLVVNKRQEYELTLYARNPLSELLDDAPPVEVKAELLILDEEAWEIEAQCIEEVTEQVQDVVVAPSTAIASKQETGHQSYIDWLDQRDRARQNGSNPDRNFQSEDQTDRHESDYIWIPYNGGPAKKAVKRGGQEHYNWLKQRIHETGCTQEDLNEFIHQNENRTAMHSAGLSEDEIREMCEE